ncbi:MAG: hypothetical protein U0V72_15945 [Cytophagales bacterium]
MNFTFKYILIVSLICLGEYSWATDTLNVNQNQELKSKSKVQFMKLPSSDSGSRLKLIFNLTKKEEEAPKNVVVSFSGQFRLSTDYRVMSEIYSGLPQKALVLNGWVQPSNVLRNQNYANPLLYLETNIKPNAKTNISVGYSFNHDFSGANDSLSRSANIFRLLMASASIDTKYGKFKIGSAGASGFPNVLSPLTSGQNTYHFNPFFKLPWDWFKSNSEKVDYFYNNQSVALDPKYSSTSAGVQGAVLECTNLPKGFGANFILGKINQTGGYLEINDYPANNLLRTLSKEAYTQTLGGRISKKIKKHEFGINGLLNTGYINNYTENLKSKQYFVTTNGILTFKKMFVNYEIGISEFSTPAPFGRWGRPETFGQGYNSGVNQMLSLKIGFVKDLVKFPSFFQLYSIGKDVVNQNSSIINTTGTNNTAIMPSYLYEVNVYRSGMLEVDQVANNRNGFLFDITREINKNLKLNFAGNYSRELSDEWDVITMQHQVSKYQRSQFGYYQNNYGPYARTLNQFIRSYETFTVTDSSVHGKKKNFYVWDFTAKRKLKVLGKLMVLGSYTSFNSVSNEMWPVPVFTNKAFVRQLYEEVNMNYLIHPKFNLTAQLGYERVEGNKQIDTTSSGKTVSQRGYCMGAGFDWMFSKNAGFYIRQVWFAHKDINFEKDKFKGFNTLAEIKVFF